MTNDFFRLINRAPVRGSLKSKGDIRAATEEICPNKDETYLWLADGVYSLRLLQLPKTSVWSAITADLYKIDWDAWLEIWVRVHRPSLPSLSSATIRKPSCDDILQTETAGLTKMVVGLLGG